MKTSNTNVGQQVTINVQPTIENDINLSFGSNIKKNEEFISPYTKIIYTSKPDEFVNSTMKPLKRGMSIKTKIAIGVGALALAAGAVYIAVRKGNFAPLRNLPEHIDFKKAKTYEEAINFGKQTLGIKNYKGFEAKDLDVLNWVNEGLVNVSNAMKGKKVRIPRNVVYTSSLKDNVYAAAISYDRSSIIRLIDKLFGNNGGDLHINKNFFNNIDKTINELINKFTDIYHIKIGDKSIKHSGLLSDDYIRNMVKNILNYNSGKIKSINDKVLLYKKIEFSINTGYQVAFHPENFLKQIAENAACKGIKIDWDIFNKLPEKASKNSELTKTAYVIDLIRRNNIRLMPNTITSPFDPIYHEMGHIQDIIPRCLTTHDFTSPAQYPKALQEWVNNKSYQAIASKVSAYATHGPAEFIAETFAGLVDGVKYSEPVIALYKSLNGPLIPGI